MAAQAHTWIGTVLLRGEHGAARLFGAAAGLIDRVGRRGHSYYQPDRELYLRARAQARAGLGAARTDALEAEGRAMAPAEALALAEEGGRRGARLSGQAAGRPARRPGAPAAGRAQR